MTRPTSIVICGQPFALLSADLGENELGRSHVAEQRLLVGRQLAHYQERDTVLHEVLHVVVELTGHKLTEGAVGGLATALLAVLRGNPDLVAWLVADDAR